MKSKSIALALVASLGFGTLAQAQDWRHNDDRRGEWRHREPSPVEQWQRQIPGQQYNVPHWEGRHEDGRRYERAPQYYGNRAYTYNAPRYDAPRPYYRGGYLPYEYRSQRYWVNDWRARHLAPPPYGYQWVQADNGDLLLVALATGLIANLILSQ